MRDAESGLIQELAQQFVDMSNDQQLWVDILPSKLEINPSGRELAACITAMHAVAEKSDTVDPKSVVKVHSPTYDCYNGLLWASYTHIIEVAGNWIRSKYGPSDAEKFTSHVYQALEKSASQAAG